jgi:acetyltransferase-like isoleucine patch superfamily enzyme
MGGYLASIERRDSPYFSKAYPEYLALLDQFVLKIKRAESPPYRLLRSVAKAIVRPRAVQVPRFAKPPLRLLYQAHYMVIIFWRLAIGLLYRNPLFQSRCASVGKNLSLDGPMPYVSGHVEITIGDDVWMGGKIVILAGSMESQPRLYIGNRAELGWNVSISVNKEVIIEDHARVSFDCRIADSDGHPREADLRAAGCPPHPKDIRPIRIGRNAWIGNGTHILKGVTIGEGAIIGANSVVVSDIPPYALALGNPAEVLVRNAGRPSKKAAE